MRKKYLFWSGVIGLTVIFSCFLYVYSERSKRKDFKARFQLVDIGDNTNVLLTTFDQVPIIFHGKDANIIFPEIKDTKANAKVYRFSQSVFFIPIVYDFLVVDQVVIKKNKYD